MAIFKSAKHELVNTKGVKSNACIKQTVNKCKSIKSDLMLKFCYFLQRYGA